MKTAFTIAMCAAVLGLPATAFAQTADQKYCQALSSSYREYNKQNTNADASAAMAKCSTDAAGAIPVLEKHLKDGKQALPARPN
jgi:hypothetical protein